MASRKRNATLKEFIAIYQSEPCLWRVKCRDYHDRDKRSASYGKLVNKLKELEPISEKDDVVRKINTFRSNVRRERKKYDESVRSGASSNDIYKPTLWYFHLFDFIGDQDARDLTFRIVKKMIPIKAQPLATRPGKKKLTDQDQLTNDVLLSVRYHFKRPASTSATEDRYTIFWEKEIINDALFDAEMGNLNIESIQNRRRLNFVPSPTHSLSSRTSTRSPSMLQQYYKHPHTHTDSASPQFQPYSSPIQQYNTKQTTYAISPLPRRQPSLSPIQQCNSQQQTYSTSSAPHCQPSPTPHEEFDTQPQTDTISLFYSNFNSEEIVYTSD
ncbi:hypothetical protein FQR65_LT09550 [Abscondita terminalis]|nr:hypothetical protein FQR65_LT09550 [Abscondita terminalis]